MTDINPVQSIEELTARFQKLDKEKTRVQTLLGSATTELEKLLEKAEQEFGTQDLDELEAKLQQLEDQNLDMRKQYQDELNSIEKQLLSVGEHFPESGEDE